MIHLRTLIEDLCPQGVSYRPMGDVGTFTRGGGPQKKDFLDEGPIGCIHYGQIYTHYGVHTDQTRSFVSADVAERSRQAKPNDVIIAVTGENDEDLAMGVAWLGTDSVAISNHTVIYTSSLDPKFVSYYLRSSGFNAQKRRWIFGTKVRSISQSNFEKIQIPVPPLEVQREIVRILDKFTQLEAELEAELEARRTQYHYYSERLLADDSTHIPAALGDLATIVRGASPRPIRNFLTERDDGIPWIKIGDAPPDGKYVTATLEKVTPEGAQRSRRVFPGDFLLSNSMSFGRPYISSIEGCVHDGWLVISHFEDHLKPDYLYHLLRSSTVQREFSRLAGSGTVKNLNADIVRSVTVSIPSLSAQERVANLLSGFDILVNDLVSGLPAEIAARRKQYEYYRDQLLTFKEAS